MAIRALILNITQPVRCLFVVSDFACKLFSAVRIMAVKALTRNITQPVRLLFVVSDFA